MTAITILLAGYLCLALLYWLSTAYGVVQLTRRLSLLAGFMPSEGQRWPRLSVIVPARNEEDKLKSAVQTLMAQDYPEFEIVLVDDRSTDGTARIIEQLAAKDEKVKAVHITELPEGWMGKVHALNRGLADSSGEYVLFTDGDIHFQYSALRKAVGYCLRENLDHLTALPTLQPSSVLLDSSFSVFLRSFFVFIGRAWALSRPKSRSYLGVGAFNLVRRSAFEATEGFEWLRREVADDMGLGLMMKSSGARCGVVAAFGYVSLQWYQTIGQASRGAEKAYASLCNFSLGQALLMSLAIVLLELAPLLLFMPLLFESVRFVGYGGFVLLPLSVFTSVSLARWAGQSPLTALTWPVGALVLASVLTRAGLLGWRRKGITWRETLYSAEQIGHDRRVRFPWLIPSGSRHPGSGRRS